MWKVNIKIPPLTGGGVLVHPAGLCAMRKASAVKPPRTNKGFKLLPNKPKPPNTDVLGGFGAPGGALRYAQGFASLART